VLVPRGLIRLIGTDEGGRARNSRPSVFPQVCWLFMTDRVEPAPWCGASIVSSPVAMPHHAIIRNTINQAAHTPKKQGVPFHLQDKITAAFDSKKTHDFTSHTLPQARAVAEIATREPRPYQRGFKKGTPVDRKSLQARRRRVRRHMKRDARRNVVVLA
jgi:hypothetical protein